MDNSTSYKWYKYNGQTLVSQYKFHGPLVGSPRLPYLAKLLKRDNYLLERHRRAMHAEAWNLFLSILTVGHSQTTCGLWRSHRVCVLERGAKNRNHPAKQGPRQVRKFGGAANLL